MNRLLNHLFKKKKKSTLSSSTPPTLLLSSTPPTFSPSLVFPHGKKYSEQTFFTLSDARWYPRCVPEMRSAVSVTCNHGWLLMLSYYKPFHIYLFNPVSFETIDLPPLRARIASPLRCGVITTSPTKNPQNCIVVFVCDDSYMFCSLNASRWIQQEFENEKQERVLSATCCEGKVYIISYGGVIVIEFDIGHRHSCDTPSAIITIHEMDRPKFSMPNTCRSACYMVESCGDIFLVQKMNLGDTNIIQSLDVFKLDLSAEMCWIKVESLGDRTFLLGEPTTSVSVSATQLGLQGDSIYFIEKDNTYLHKFDMDSGCIAVTQPCPNIIGKRIRPFWLVPDKLSPYPNGIRHDEPPSSFLVSNVNSLEKDSQKEVGNEVGILKNLPEEIICHISAYLLDNFADLQNLVDYTCFRFACKALKLILPPLCPDGTISNHLMPFSSSNHQIAFGSGSQQSPWLMSISKRNLEFKFHHPVNNWSFTCHFPELNGAVIHHCKYGWLLLSDETNSFFFFNPITREIIKLPGLPQYYDRNIAALSFSSPPTSLDYIVLGHYDWPSGVEVDIIVYRSGQNGWEVYNPKTKVSFHPSYCNCFFYDGLFYCLDRDGKLGVFNTKNGLDEDSVWSIFPHVVGPKNMDRSFLVECDGEILSVFIGSMGGPVCVFKLERLEKKMKWVKLENLGNKMIFLSHTTSILAQAKSKAMKNKIFIPIFREKRGVFYSLSTGKYHTIGSNDSRDDWINTYTELQSTWIELNAMELYFQGELNKLEKKS